MAVVSLSELIARFVAVPVKVTAAVEVSVKKAAMKVRDTAVKKFGKYQDASGDFPEWEKLKPTTVQQKMKAGSIGDDPLIGHYSGKGHKVWPSPLRNTIGIKVEGFNAAIGSDDPLMKYHEYGTENIPPRPVLRPSLFEEEDEIVNDIKEGVAIGMSAM